MFCKIFIDNIIIVVKYELLIIIVNILLFFIFVNNLIFNGIVNVINYIVNGVVKICVSWFVFWIVIFVKFIFFLVNVEVKSGINGNIIVFVKIIIICVNVKLWLYILNCFWIFVDDFCNICGIVSEFIKFKSGIDKVLIVIGIDICNIFLLFFFKFWSE